MCFFCALARDFARASAQARAHAARAPRGRSVPASQASIKKAGRARFAGTRDPHTTRAHIGAPAHTTHAGARQQRARRIYAARGVGECEPGRARNAAGPRRRRSDNALLCAERSGAKRSGAKHITLCYRTTPLEPSGEHARASVTARKRAQAPMCESRERRRAARAPHRRADVVRTTTCRNVLYYTTTRRNAKLRRPENSASSYDNLKAKRIFWRPLFQVKQKPLHSSCGCSPSLCSDSKCAIDRARLKSENFSFIAFMRISA